jgi:glycosyltransferase involved in cell wall biosynthesis
MRYLWNLGGDTRGRTGLSGLISQPVFHHLRQWDIINSFRVDHFIANSRNTQRRIAALYRREAEIIHPPVSTERFEIDPAPGDFYLFVGELVEYKRADLAVEACRELGLPLVVIGEGAHRKRIEKRAGPSVSFLGRQDDASVASYMQRCRALIFPGEEDFGIVPVEVMAAGRPVIALGKGGALETVVPERTGLLFPAPTVADLVAALQQMEACHERFAPSEIRAHAEGFDTRVFRARMQAFIEGALDRFRADARRGTRTVTP